MKAWNKIKAYFKDKKEMKKIELSITLMAYFLLSLIFFYIFFVLLYMNFGLALNFGAQRHNIDLTMNFAQLCGDCIWELQDMGTDSRGNLVNTTLANSYVESMYLNQRQYEYSAISSFVMGVSFVLALLYFSGTFITYTKLEKYMQIGKL